MRVYAAVYGKTVVDFFPTEREAALASMEYGAKVGPDPTEPREQHFMGWLDLSGKKDCPRAWAEYITALDDRNVCVAVDSVPRRDIKELVCKGLAAVVRNGKAEIELDDSSEKQTKTNAF